MLQNDDASSGNRLTTAINENDVETVKELLKKGYKPDFKYVFYGSFLGDNTAPEIPDLLAEYIALPQGVSLSTLKFVLFAMGNPYIPRSDFWEKSDLNLNGWSERLSPLVYFARNGNVRFVNALIQRGVTERPLNLIFSIHETHFKPMYGRSMATIEACKVDISSKFNDPNFSALKEQCEVVKLLLRNPTSEIDTFIEKEKTQIHHKTLLIAFFAWAAKNDDAELFNIPHFKKLFLIDRNSAKTAIIIAAVFGSAQFLTRAIQEGFIDSESIAQAYTIAGIHGDDALLTRLMKLPLSQETSAEIAQFHKVKDDHPLRWAIFNGHMTTTKILLKNEPSPNDYKEHLIAFNYLQLASRYGHTQLMKLLLSYKPDINYQDILGQTALHNAAQIKNLDAMALLIAAGADTNMCNMDGQKPLDAFQEDELHDLQERIAICKEEMENEHRTSTWSLYSFFSRLMYGTPATKAPENTSSKPMGHN